MQPPQPYKEVQPLVIRANKGDEIRINFYNSLGRRASMHVQGLRYDVLTLDGAHEEQHAFNINGMSWKKGITDPVSPIAAEQTIGISEAFNIRIDEYYGAGDYLHYFGEIDDVWLGLWGIIRAHGCRRKHLRPLCDPTKPVPFPDCPPKGARIKKFEIAAIQTNIEYNRYGDHDPEGMLFVPLEYAEDVKCGRKKPIPLILRANAGDWIEITLHNMFDKPVLYHDYPSVPLDMPFEPSDRVSLSPQHLKRCPVCSAGVNVGYNAPGECIKYLWYADKEYGDLYAEFLRRPAQSQIPRLVRCDHHRAARSEILR